MTYPPNAPFVTAQPTQFDIHSNFRMFPGERLLYHCDMKTGCCELGDRHITSVTDTRYVERTEFPVCCGCCCNRPFNDSCIYLHDVSQIHEVRGKTLGCRCCSDGCLLCCCCCFMTTKRLQLRGAFGSHLIYISSKETSEFESIITEAIAQHKLPNRH